MSRLEDSIMEMRHHFIYGKEVEERGKKLREVEKNNPIVIDQDRPMCIYLDTIGLPNIKTDIKSLDSGKINLFAREYFSFVLWDNLLTKFRESVDVSKEQERINEFLKVINRMNEYNANSIDNYAGEIKRSRDAFLEAYIRYIQTGEIKPFIEDLKVPFIMVEIYIRKFKSMLNNNSFFAVIANHTEDISLSSFRAINDFVCSRINGDISMNVVTEPDKWRTYYSGSGQLAEYVHDYGVIELDNSLCEHIKKLKKQFADNDEQ